jgi:hypothetical protein
MSYKITTEDMPYNGKVRKPDPMLDELLSSSPRPPVTRAAVPTLPYYKVAAVLVWFGAVYTTYLMIASLQPGTPLAIILPVAFGMQFVFTMAEKPIMTGRAGIFTYAVFLLDALINAGGMYPALANIGRTPTAQMLASAGTPSDVGAWASVLLAIAMGCIIAVAPEALWKQR